MAKLDAVVAKTNTGTNHQKQEKQDHFNQMVQRMLVKSRAECGDRKQIREEDRFYVELVTVHDVVKATDATANDKYDDDANPVESNYRFFSKMTTVGRLADVASTINSKNENVNVEVLVRLSFADDDDDDDERYFRLPNTMTLYEANERDFVKPFDRLIVRSYDRSTCDATVDVSDTKLGGIIENKYYNRIK